MRISLPGIKGLFAIMASLLMLTLTSCEKMFEYEGDCEPKHKIRFVYDMNLKWADAFSSEVHSVNLYIFDEKGLFVKEYAARGEEIDASGYLMDIDVPVGKDYTFVAWCGLDNEGVSEESFSVTQPSPGVTTLDEFLCSLNASTTPPSTRAEQDGQGIVYSNSQLQFLYHGILRNEYITDEHEGLTYIHTIYLTKDTNHIRIMLQELDSDGIDNPDDFKISINSVNGVLNYNNLPIGNTIVQYSPWKQVTDMMGVGSIDPDNNTVTNRPGLVSDLSVSRLMADQQDSFFLKITDVDGKLIANIPFIQYALMSREYFEEAYKHPMSEQEFLDRKDEYEMTFFLEGGKWVYATINILDWRMVIKNYDLN